MLDLEKLNNEELGLIRLGLLSLISINIQDKNDKTLCTEMLGNTEKEQKTRAKKTLEKTLENVHVVCQMTGMNEDAVRKKVIEVYNETHPDCQIQK